MIQNSVKDGEAPSDFNYTELMHALPFHDLKGSIKGFQLAWFDANNSRQWNRFKTSSNFLNLLDQDMNNLYNYKSNLVNVGTQRINIDTGQVHKYAVIVSASLLKDIIDREVFDEAESSSILDKAI